MRQGRVDDGKRSSPQACKPQARAPQTDMELSSALVWNVSRSAFKRHKATDENAHFCRDAIVLPSAAGAAGSFSRGSRWSENDSGIEAVASLLTEVATAWEES